MNAEQLETKEALLCAAGELFADLGYDGASTRAIARRANANMAAIGYHFNGKENLYLETLRSVMSQKCTWSTELEQAYAATQSGVPLREALRRAARSRLADAFDGDRPAWHTKLIVRALQEPSPSMRALNEETFKPDVEQVTKIACKWNPGLSQQQAKLWANSLFGQEVVYILAQAVILDLESWDQYPTSYLDEVADHMALVAAASLWPDELRKVVDGGGLKE